MDTGSTAPAAPGPVGSGQDRSGSFGYPPDAACCADELLSIVAYLTARDGPLQASSDAQTPVSPWHERLLGKAAERLAVVDAFMRARVAFLVAGKERGYYAPQVELDLAGATLDSARTASVVVDALLEGRLPSRHEFDAMCATALRVNPALEALREAETPHTR